MAVPQTDAIKQAAERLHIALPGPEVYTEFSGITPELQEHPYPYDDLKNDSIRLLKIHPGDGEISCELQQLPLTRELKFTALSYKWGRKPDDCKILLNGHAVGIRKNLWRFLRKARKLSDPRFHRLWIDALCINQNSNRERMHQVELMPHIFKNAQSVIVWLGPAYGGSGHALDSINEVPARMRPRRNSSARWGKKDLFAISMLCMRSYWRRLWILQEIILADRVWLMCGSKIAPWEPFRDLLLRDLQWTSRNLVAVRPRTEDNIEDMIIPDSPAMVIVSQTDHRLQSINLFELMEYTRYLQCAEPRDKIYALLGIARQGQQDIVPDYDLPIPTILNSVLKSHHQCDPPRDLATVLRQCEQLAEIFDLPVHAMFDLDGQSGIMTPPNEADLACGHLGPPGSIVTMWWTSFYGHKTIDDLIWREISHSDGQYLCRAAAKGSVLLTEMLLAKGVGADTTDHDGQNALSCACENGHLEVVKILLRHGASVDTRSLESACTPLLLCALSPDKSDIASLLVRYGADVNMTANSESTLYIALCHRRTDIARLILSKDVDLNFRNGAEARTALHSAAENGFKDIVELMLKNGADAGAQDKNLRTPLHEAARQGHLEVVDILIKAGVNIHATNHAGRTALATAASRGHFSVVQLLLANGASAGDFNIQLTSLLRAAAVGGGHEDELRNAFRSRKSVDPEQDAVVLGEAISRAAAHGHIEIVQLLLEYGAEPDAQRPDFSSALQSATTCGHEDIVLLLRANLTAKHASSSRAVKTSGIPRYSWTDDLQAEPRSMITDLLSGSYLPIRSSHATVTNDKDTMTSNASLLNVPNKDSRNVNLSMPYTHRPTTFNGMKNWDEYDRLPPDQEDTEHGNVSSAIIGAPPKYFHRRF